MHDNANRPIRFALVAGEASGDALGAGLVRALRERFPDAEFAGACGPAMRDAGVEAWADASYYSGRPFDAMEQLKRMLMRDDLSYYARARIQARIAELTPLVLELRKRRIETPDNPATRDGTQQ